jgi:DNA polymerase-3 subunit gamma/tau
MSYQVLARKWRPKSFSEMAGQEHVLKALINALDNDRLHHAYLFTGTRGVGKTTLGRIMAKCLNCEEGVSSSPCGKCQSCLEIDSGRFIDLIEVDAASRTGVDDMRDLTDNVQYSPSRGRFKVYLIDEVHMLTKNSWAALLKTLEEPPPHVKFLFATTDPDKVPITVLSRCLQFNLKNLSAQRITEHLKFVLGEEKTVFDEAGLRALAQAADGSMRDALSLADQAIGHGGGSISEVDVISMLGSIDRQFVIEICRAMASNSGDDLLKSVDRMSEQSPDYEVALSEILSVWHQVAILQTVPEALDNNTRSFNDLMDLSKVVSVEDVQLFYQICLLGRKDLPLAPSHRSGFEMIMLRALAFRPVIDGKPNSQNRSPMEVEPQIKKSKADRSVEVITDLAKAKSERSVVSITPSIPDNSAESAGCLEDKLKNLDITLLEDESELVHQPSKETVIVDFKSSLNILNECNGADHISLGDFEPNNWIDVRNKIDIGGSLGEIASHCMFKNRIEDTLYFMLDHAEDSLFDSSHSSGLAEVLSAYFGQTVFVEIDSGTVARETPRAAAIREKSESHAAAVQRLNADPAVKKFKELFDGSLDEESVESID